jgi:hypothetical protein
MALAPNSIAKMIAVRSILEKGLGELQSPAKYEIEAATLRIQPAAPNSIARVPIGRGQEDPGRSCGRAGAGLQ